MFHERSFAVTLPEVNYNSETGVIVVQPKNRKPFTVRTLPVSTSFALFEKSVLIDYKQSVYFCVLSTI